ncbi:energy-coupling factor transporter transmembrane component T family protein [Agromyces archimandritae]|uniref:Energy-coupling factor transporter transmembrane protein EcfT n=1 Tax=Agromyces archimandritae TaxID=2781962 RepID=A0A975FL54_9MICO|nr:energy-coupling factor transporter transmembrane component T [Agromyces archimandritae]QTX04518.1 energy-coupling factor transporter transmembrane protein EcfT [Agromyces archimandritae]
MSIGLVRAGLPLASINPVAKLLAAVPLSVALILTLDPVSAATALLAELALFAAVGLGPLAFSVRTLPVWIAAPLTGVSMLLYGESSGATFFEFGLIHISEGSIHIAASTTLRVLAIALPAVVLFLTIDPTDLADGLAQTLRLPARFVLGALAALRLAGTTVDDWRMLSLARRARGVGDGAFPVRFARQSLALLVLAVRRGGTLATAMEARGFGSDVPRSWWRPARFGRAEWATVAAGAAVAALAVGVAVATGSWNVIWHG